LLRDAYRAESMMREHVTNLKIGLVRSLSRRSTGT
jgi:hypothetical protein